MFQLKTHCNLSFGEMDLLTAEDRGWWLERQKRYDEEVSKKSKSQRHPMPSVPRVPKKP
jgi:hypothetical protein